MSDDHKPVTRDDVTDDRLVAGELRMLRGEMRDWFELMISRLDRYEERIQSLERNRIYSNEQMHRHEHRIAALEAAALPKPTGDKP